MEEDMVDGWMDGWVSDNVITTVDTIDRNEY
jgi:hypothetical protein